MSQDSVYKWRYSVNRRRRKMKLVPKGVNVICSLIFQLNIKYYENILVKDLDLNFNMKCNVRNKKSESAYKRKSKFLQKSTVTPNKNIEEKTVHHFDGLCLFYLRTRMCPLHSLSPRMLSPGYFHP